MTKDNKSRTITITLPIKDADILSKYLAHGQQQQLGKLFWSNIINCIKHDQKDAYLNCMYKSEPMVLLPLEKLED